MLFDCMYECGGRIARHVDGPQWADGGHRNGMRAVPFNYRTRTLCRRGSHLCYSSDDETGARP